MTSKYDDFLESLETRDPGALIQKEVIVDSKTGLPRQAGATQAEGEFIRRLKHIAERNLFVFSKGIMNRTYLTRSLHLPMCQRLQQCPPFRKMVLFPRDHAKTSVVSHCLPLHIIIQQAATNPYFPGLDGTDCRILLSGETETRATGNLRVMRTAFEENALLRSLWPHACWDNPRRQAKKWNDQELICPRESEYPDPTIRAIGVGGAITGARPNVLIKDDLVSIEAANSTVVMQAAIDWHVASRALMDEYEHETGLESLEFIVGTRWAVYDLYQYIIDEDPTVEYWIRAIVEDEKTIWFERFNMKKVEQLRKEFGSMFWLLYMNSAANPDLTDFDTTMIREFALNEGVLMFTDDERDVVLTEGLKEAVVIPKTPRGAELNKHTWDMLLGKGRGEYLRFKYK